MSLLDFRFIKRLFNVTPIDQILAVGDQVDTALNKLQGQLNSVKASNEPTGFLDRTQSTISFVDSTRVFSITPVSGSYTIYLKGFSTVISATKTVTLSNVTGLQYIYFDYSNGLLTASQTFSEDVMTKHAYVAVVYYRSDLQTHIYIADERHGITMDGATRYLLHTAFGSQYVSGLALNNIIADGSGDLDTSATIGVDNGVIRGEDIQINATNGSPQTIAPIGRFPILYRVGSDTNWFRTTTIDNFPVINTRNATYSNGSGRPAYNWKNGASWQLSEVTNNDYFLIHVIATNDMEYPIQIIQGNKYASLTAGRDGALVEFPTYSGLPFTEFVLIATLIYQVSSTYNNTVKARIRTNSAGTPYVDWRKTTSFNTGGLSSLQNAIQTVSSSSGSYTAATPTDTISIVGSGTISTSISGNVLTITSSGPTVADTLAYAIALG